MAQPQFTDEELLARGNRAAAIVNDPLFREAIEKLKTDVVGMWADTPTRDKEGRDWLWLHYQVSLKFEQVFMEIMNSGKLAAESLRQNKTEGAIDRVVNYWRR